MMHIELNIMMSLSRACQNLNATSHNIIKIRLTCNEEISIYFNIFNIMNELNLIKSFEIECKRITRYSEWQQVSLNIIYPSLTLNMFSWNSEDLHKANNFTSYINSFVNQDKYFSKFLFSHHFYLYLTTTN